MKSRCNTKFISEKVDKKYLDELIELQYTQIKHHTFIQTLLKIFQNNPKDFHLLFDDKIIDYYAWEKDYGLYHFCERFSHDVCGFDKVCGINKNPKKHFKLVSTGVYQYIEFSKYRNKNFISQFYAYYEPFSYTKWGL